MSKINTLILSSVFLIMTTLLQVFASQGLCQEDNSLQLFDILAEADNLLSDKSYGKSEASAQTLKEKLKRIIEDIERSKNLCRSAEERSVCEMYIIKLKKRKMACQLVIDGKKLPSRNMVEQQKLQNCIRLLKDYVKDTTRTVFVDRASATDIKIQKIFLRQLALCLNTLAKDENSIRQASSLLTELFIYKRVDLAKCIEALIETGHFEAAGRLIAVIAKSSSDTQRITDLVKGILSTPNFVSVIELFKEILAELSDDPQKMQRLDGETIKSLLDLIRRFEDNQCAARIFQKLVDMLPPASSDARKMAEVVQRIEDDVLQRTHGTLDFAMRLSQLAKQTKILSQKGENRKLRLNIGTIWRGGHSQVPIKLGYKPEIEKQLKDAFKSQKFVPSLTSSVTDSKSTQSWEEAISEELPVPGSTLRELRHQHNNKQKNPDIVITGSYSFQGENTPLIVQLVFVEAETDVVLYVCTEEIIYDENFKVFQKYVKEAAKSVATNFEDALTAYREFEIFCNEFPADKTDLKKFRSYLFYGTVVDIERYDNYDEECRRPVDYIYIAKDFFETQADGKRFFPFLTALNERMVKEYKELGLPIETKDISVGETKDNFLQISCKKGTGNDWLMNVLIRRHYNPPVSKIKVKFRQNQSSPNMITTDQAEYAAGFVTEIVKSIPGLNQKEKDPEIERIKIKHAKEMERIKIKCDEGISEPKITSFFMPGEQRLRTYTAQNEKPPWHLKAWNYSNIALLGLAVVSEAAYINTDYDNDALFHIGVTATVAFIVNGVLGVWDAAPYEPPKINAAGIAITGPDVSINGQYNEPALMLTFRF